MYNNPSEMTVTTENNVSVTSSFSYSGLGISVVFYFEPVNIIKVEHVVDNKKIDTNKNLGFIPFPTSTSYDTHDVNYAPKIFESLNKNFWPGYILTGYTVYSESVSPSNIILKETFDVNTTTKLNSKNDAKRKALISTAIASTSDINGGTIVNKERVGYGKDKIIVFNYLYPEVEIKNLNYKTNVSLKSLDNESLEYKIKLIGDNMLVKSLDTTKPKNENGYNELNLNLSNGTFKNFKYDASNYSLVQVYIYTKDLNKGTKTLYKVIAGNDSFIPNGIPDSKVQVANDFASFANMYILNTEDLLTVINKVWSDLYIEFKYFEGANVVNVSYVDEEGNVLMPPEVYKILDEGNGGYTATIPVTPIDGYELVKYVLDDKEDKNVSTLEEVSIVDNGKDREVIYVYKKKDREDTPPEVYENPMAIIRSNNRKDEEYNVDIAMPTDEDLYANVITDSYIIENVLSVLDKTQKVSVILKKKYYTSNNDNDSSITSNIDIKSATIPLEYDLAYSYMGGANSNLFILENAIIDNEAVFDKKHYDKNGKVLIEADYKDKVPYLTYIPGGKLFIEDSEECKLIKDGDVYYLEVTLSGIDYEEPDMNAIANSYKNNHEVIDQIIRRNATVNGDYLSVTAENEETRYLDGNYIYMSADRLANVLELSSAGYYFISSKAPLINSDVLFNNRNVYTYTKAQNIRYDSTKLTVNYILHQGVRNLIVSDLDGKSAEESGVDSIQRVKEYTPSDIKMNYIKVYTPIVNYAELIPLNNSNQNDNQLIDTSIQNVLTLDSVFSILIPHSGDHIYARFEDGKNYDGYGIKDYNYNGSRLYDEKDFTDKGLKGASFSKMKLVKFSFDVYALKYSMDGKSVKYQKFIPANTWFNLGEIDSNTGLNIEKYNFIIPTWVKDKEYGDIKVRIVAGNIPDVYDSKADETSGVNLSYIAEDVANEEAEYVLEKNFRVYIAGVLYDLEIRDSDDTGWMGKLKTVLKLGNSIADKNMFLPIGQSNQNSLIAYKFGLKLGYRFYFDLKTKGIASDEVQIKPNFYYVSADGKTVTKDISLFYNTKDSKYVKLNDENDLDIKLIMSSTHGNVNNDKFTFELVKGKLNNSSKDYTAITIIGKILKGLNLVATDTKLPRDNILESANLYGYKGNITKFIEDAKLSEIVENEDTIRNSAGHYYGEFYLPASTKVALGSNVTRNDVIDNEKLLLTDGYIVVTFDEIITKSNSEEYLTYDNPVSDSRWKKEGTSYEPYEINLPNGNKAKIDEMVKGTAMAIYEVSLRANDDYEVEGTH